MQIEDMSKYYNKSLKDDDTNLNKYAFRPFKHAVLCGSTGSGKTNILLNLLTKPGYSSFCELYIFAKDIHEDAYDYLTNYFAEVERKINTKLKTQMKDNYYEPCKIFHISNELKDLPKLEEFEGERKKRIIVFDDMLNEKNQEGVKDYMIRSRKLGCQVIYLTQAYFLTPKIIRDNSSYVLFFPTTRRNLLEISKSVASKLDTKNFMKACQYVFDKNPHAFILCDSIAKDNDLCLREGFDGTDLYKKFVNWEEDEKKKKKEEKMKGRKVLKEEPMSGSDSESEEVFKKNPPKKISKQRQPKLKSPSEENNEESMFVKMLREKNSKLFK